MNKILSLLKKRKKLIALLSLAVWFYTYSFFFWWGPSQSQIQMLSSSRVVEVKQEDIVSSLSLLGKSKIKNEQSLNFNVEGTVSEVHVKQGDKVEKGTLLANVNPTKILNEVRTNTIALEDARRRYNSRLENIVTEKEKLINNINLKKQEQEKKKKEITHVKNEQKLQLENKEIELENARIEFKKAKNNLDIRLMSTSRIPREKQIAFEEAQKDYIQQSKDYQKDVSLLDTNLQKNIREYGLNFTVEYNSLKEAQRSVEASLKSFNNLLKINPDYEVENTQLKQYFSAKNSVYKSDATKYYRETWGAYEKIQDYIKNKTSFSSIQELLEVNALEIELYQALWKLAENISKGADESIYSFWIAEKGVFRSYKSSAESLITDSASKLVNLKKRQDEIRLMTDPSSANDKKVLELEKRKNALEKLAFELEKMKKELESLSWVNPDKITQIKLDLKTKENDLKLKEIEYVKFSENQKYDLTSMQSSYKNLDIEIRESEKRLSEYSNSRNEGVSAAKSSVRQAKITLEDSQKKLDDYRLIAPFSGIISEINMNVWDNLSSENKKTISIQNPNIIEINSDVDQVDLIKISKWASAIVKFNAYQDLTFTGSILNISSSPKGGEWASQYGVTIIVDVSQSDKKIYSGMTANIEIVLKKLENVITVTNTSLEVDPDNGKQTVTVIADDGTETSRIVETWFSDGKRTEIISGLKTGEKIREINFEKNTIPLEKFGGEDSMMMY